MDSIQEPTIAPSVETSERVLIAEDHDSARNALANLLEWKGFAVTTAADGEAALNILISDDAPSIALLDWEMPGLSGLDICRELRSHPAGRYLYLIVITAREGEEGIAEAIAAGADDFIRKPFGVPEVIARVRNGQRTLKLERSLAARITELEQALEAGRQLKRSLAICMHCRKIRDDSDRWRELESYLRDETGTEFTSGVCPACMEKARAGEHPADFSQGA